LRTEDYEEDFVEEFNQRFVCGCNLNMLPAFPNTVFQFYDIDDLLAVFLF